MTEPEKKNLEEEAQALRDALRRQREAERKHAFPTWKKAVYLFLILSSLAGSAFLLISQETRESLVQRVAAGAFDLYPAESRLYRLPAPPPRVAEPVVRIQGPSNYSSEGYEGVLYADMDPSGSEGDDDADGEEDEFIAPPKSPGSQEAFALLVEKSELVAELVDGQIEGFEFLEWTPLQNDPPRFLIDLTANQEGSEIHLVWQVNLENEDVQPMSQAARDLAAPR